MKLFIDWEQEFILNPSGLPWKGLTNEQQQRMSRQAKRFAFAAYLHKHFGGRKVVMSLLRWNINTKPWPGLTTIQSRGLGWHSNGASEHVLR